MNLPTTVAPFILRGVTLRGIDCVYQPLEPRIDAYALLAKHLTSEQVRFCVCNLSPSNLFSARSNRPERNHWSGCIARFGRSNVGGQHFRALCGRPITLKNTIIKQPNPLVLHLHVIWWNGSSIFCSIIYSLLILLHSPNDNE